MQVLQAVPFFLFLRILLSIPLQKTLLDTTPPLDLIALGRRIPPLGRRDPPPRDQFRERRTGLYLSRPQETIASGAQKRLESPGKGLTWLCR